GDDDESREPGALPRKQRRPPAASAPPRRHVYAARVHRRRVWRRHRARVAPSPSATEEAMRIKSAPLGFVTGGTLSPQALNENLGHMAQAIDDVAAYRYAHHVV